MNLQFPSVEVRFENVSVEAGVYVGTRGLPTLLNFTMNMISVRSILAEENEGQPTVTRWLALHAQGPALSAIPHAPLIVRSSQIMAENYH